MFRNQCHWLAVDRPEIEIKNSLDLIIIQIQVSWNKKLVCIGNFIKVNLSQLKPFAQILHLYKIIGQVHELFQKLGRTPGLYRVSIQNSPSQTDPVWNEEGLELAS